MNQVPIIRVGNVLIATLQEDLTDADALAFQEALNLYIERTETDGVLIDATAVSMVDSFLGRLLSEVALGARLLGAPTVLVGVQPRVAMTLVELGLSLGELHTALTVDRGIALLATLAARERGRLRGR